MFDTLIIMTGVIICVALLKKADVHITVNHTYKNLDQENTVQAMSQEEMDKFMKEQEKTPTFDDILKAVQAAVGGTDEI